MCGSTIFGRQIFPAFPFARNDWMAIAFERDNYDNTRLPEWFFVEARNEFARPGSQIFIKGYGERFGRSEGDCVGIPFEWVTYKAFMQSSENYSPEYQMQGDSSNWGFWADPEISVWGGDAAIMARIFDRKGGKAHVVDSMFKDFHLSEMSANRDLQTYLRSLVFRPVGDSG